MSFPSQTALLAASEDAVTTGRSLTLIVAEAVFTQPFSPVRVTVYVAAGPVGKTDISGTVSLVDHKLIAVIVYSSSTASILPVPPHGSPKVILSPIIVQVV